jgi:hypothetical protein
VTETFLSGMVGPWPAPADGFDREMRPSRRELRTKPLRRQQIMAIRVTMLLAGSASAVLEVFNLIWLN